MQAHQLLKLNKKYPKRVGRGGKRGTYSGRGIKGQKARSGRRIRPQIRDIIKKIHKRRGHGKHRSRSVNPSHTKPAIVNLGDLERKFSALGESAFGGNDGDKITPQVLVKAGLVKVSGGKMPKIKILAGGLRSQGKLTKKLIFDKNLLMSKSAKEHVGKI